MTERHPLEQKIGHNFTDPALLQRALTHASLSRQNYERLEFLGDRVLGLLIAEWLSELHPMAEEGSLAKALAMLAARDSLAIVAREIGIGSELRLAASDAATGRDNPSILADACEAVIAALYLDGGLDVARRFVRGNWRDLIESLPETGDAKSRLQEWTQARGLGLPHYVEKGREGPDHAPRFVVEVQIKGHAGQSASGSSKRVAERAAAEAMLRALEGK